MPFSRLLRKFSQPSLARRSSADAERPSSSSADDPEKRPVIRQASEPVPTIPRSWRIKRPSTADRFVLSPLTSSPPITPEAEDPKSDGEVREVSMPMPMPMPLPTTPSVFLTAFPIEPPPETIPTISPVPDKLLEAWDTVKGDPTTTDASPSRGLNPIDALGDVVATVQDDTAPFTPVVKAIVTPVQQTDVGKAIKEGIDKFSEGMPLLMNALDELKGLHPFIGVVILAFKTVYTLEQKRRGNDKRIIALYVGMKDMMGVLFLLKDMENDKLVAPDGISIEDRLKSLVDRTADDIKTCSNVCDTYTKKRLLAKVLLSTVWDAKLLEFVQLFATRRQEFEFELSMHTSQGIDKANAKLDAIGDATRALNEQMDVMKALFQQLTSPEHKQLSELVAAKGGAKALKDDDKVLQELEKAESKASTAPKAEVGRARREQHQDNQAMSRNINDLRRDVLEDPNAAVEKNLVVFARKFEAQKNQIIDELTLVVKRESDRVVRELKGGAHERILDRSIHEIWTDMGWRGNVKARHFVLALRDYYLEKLASGTESFLGAGNAGVTLTPDPDAWAIKHIDVMRLQPILEAIDDDASGFITIGEMNRFTASRPRDWSMAHWVAFWAVGYRASIIDYANKIDELFSKMEGVYTEVLPLNRQAVVDYFANVWEPVHTIIAALLPLQPGQDDEPEKFRSYLEKEEDRLGNNLKAVDYIIDGTDTLTLITGIGRIEKTVFPLLYLLMKRHYEIMRIMRTKVLDARELSEGVKSMSCVQDAIRYRVDDLTNNFIQQKLDVEKQFQNFAYGMFKYFNDRKALWSGDYVRGRDPRIIPYDDANEDQNVKVDDILKFDVSHEPVPDYWVYDGHSIDDVPNYGNVEPPLEDILGHWHGYLYENGGIRETDGTDSMMTFVLEPSDGEQSFKANGWSNRGRFDIAGSWSKGENDVVKVHFKMSFKVAIWNNVFFNGQFDPVRDALTGTWGYLAELESSIAPMEFRRIEPRYLAVYPSIKELADNKPRALWKFAIAAVRNDIRQQRCSWSYIAQRRDDRRTVVSFTVRYLFFGKPLDGEEIQKLCATVQRLTPADACFYGSMAYRKRAYTLMHENLYCDSCGGRMGWVRLFCLDCVSKDGETFDTLDLCCASESQCIDARITHRGNLVGPHEPHHRLVKLRTVLLTQHFGRTYRLACEAFERVEGSCTKIAEAESSQQSQEEKETAQDVQDVSTQEPTTTEIPSSSDKPGDGLAIDGPTDGAEVEPTTTGTPLQSDRKSDDGSIAVDDTRNKAEAEPTATEVPSKNGQPDDDPPSTDGVKNQIETAPETPARVEGRDEDLPTCGKCKGSLSFPFWYCIFCEDNLFICDACDAEGVPELMRSSGKHTEEHHLIRCLAPANGDNTDPVAEERLTSIESRLDTMHTRFDDLCDRIGDLTTRIGNIEQLLHNLPELMKAALRGQDAQL